MASSRDEEPRRRKKEYDRDSTSTTKDKDRDKDRDNKDKDKDKDKERHRSSKRVHRKRSEVDVDRPTERDSARLERPSIPDLQPRPVKKVTMLVPEMDRRSSTGETRVSSYPSFSKAHSRESTSRDDTNSKTAADASDMGPKRRSHDSARPRPTTATSDGPVRPPSRAPPSPPLTADEPDLNRNASRTNSKQTSERPRPETLGARKSMDSGLRTNSQSRASDSSSSKPKPSTRKPSRCTSDSENESDTSDSSTAVHDHRRRRHRPPPITRSPVHSGQQQVPARNSSVASDPSSQTTADSQATSRAADRKMPSHPRSVPSTAGGMHGGDYKDGAWRAPILDNGADPVRYANVHVDASTGNYQQGNQFFPQPAAFSPHSGAFSPQPLSDGMPPPPPPPPVLYPQDVPRVDYLLLNGGLARPIARSFIPPAASPRPVRSNDKHPSALFPTSTGHSMNDLTEIFGQLGTRVDDLWTVLSKAGSVAAATGYRSVARKMLDRLCTIFCRDLTAELCHCVMCHDIPRSEDAISGYDWGEILEYAAGRLELPQWPPFTITSNTPGLGISEAPMQRLDPDVPEDWREHYMKQNARTKRVVQDWLQRHTEVPSAPPLDVDNETLTFAMITHLEPERRPIFTALIKGMSSVPASRAPTPANESDETLSKAAVAIQRVHRLHNLPREPETAMYLLNNPSQHDMLATVSAVQPGEWDIIVSGRFDGFLWGGGDTSFSPAQLGSMFRAPSRGPTATPMSAAANNAAPSRGTTPFSPLRNVMSPDFHFQHHHPPPSRGSTPGPGFGSTGAVSYDEDMEIAVAGEVEQELFRAMEMVEDHLEQVHTRAQTVLDALRLRSSGLIAAARARKGSLASEVDVRMDTPASMMAGGGGLDEGSYLDDGASELAPDDSASNIGFVKRRKARRHERRTPAAVEEEDEEGVASSSSPGAAATGSGSRRHR